MRSVMFALPPGKQCVRGSHQPSRKLHCPDYNRLIFWDGLSFYSPNP